MVDGDQRRSLERFIEAPIGRPTLGLVYGRRRIGKSTLLVDEVRARGGFYYEATRVETPMQLRRLGTALAEHLGMRVPFALDSWDAAVGALIDLGRSGPVPIVLDELGHVLEADRSVPSVLSAAIGPSADVDDSQARLILCGSAIAMMRSLTSGEAPLRGRAGLELVMQPDGFRVAATRLHDPADVRLAAGVYACIGGVVGYATDMVDHDLPRDLADLDRWICERVLSPASPLHHEATTLLAEDPTVGGRSATAHHAILGAIANGAVTFGTISKAVGRSTNSLAPFLNRLVDAGFVERLVDPTRDRRPQYALADPFLQLHYAVLDPHRARLRNRDIREVWDGRLKDVHSSRVRGPVFEQQARTWAARFATAETLGGPADHVGPSVVAVHGTETEVDVVITESVPGGDDVPADRRVVAIGEAKAGETITGRHLARLERARASFGPRAARARLLLFGTEFDVDTTGRADVELVDLERMYAGD